jgi:hypothetical protein
MGLAIRRYFQKKSVITLILTLIFLFVDLAVFFLWVSKLILVYFLNVSDVPANFVNPWIIAIIIKFRFSFVFVVIVAYLSYVLRVKVFDSGYNKRMRIFNMILAIFIIVFALSVNLSGEAGTDS